MGIQQSSLRKTDPHSVNNSALRGVENHESTPTAAHHDSAKKIQRLARNYIHKCRSPVDSNMTGDMQQSSLNHRLSDIYALSRESITNKGCVEYTLPEHIRLTIEALGGHAHSTRATKQLNIPASLLAYFDLLIQHIFPDKQTIRVESKVVINPRTTYYHIDGRESENHPCIRVLVPLSSDRGTYYISREDKELCTEQSTRSIENRYATAIDASAVPTERVKEADANKALILLKSTCSLPNTKANSVFRSNSLTHATPSIEKRGDRYLLRLSYVLMPIDAE